MQIDVDITEQVAAKTAKEVQKHFESLGVEFTGVAVYFDAARRHLILIGPPGKVLSIETLLYAPRSPPSRESRRRLR